MKANGFITKAEFLSAEEDADSFLADLHIHDCEIGEQDPQGGLFIVEIRNDIFAGTVCLNKPNAEALVEALQEIISRYPDKEEKI